MTLDELLQYKPEKQPEIVCIIGSNKFFDTIRSTIYGEMTNTLQSVSE